MFAPVVQRPATPALAVLAVLAAAQFLLVLDATAVGASLAALQAGAGLSAGAAHWIVTAHALAFAALLLPAGRAADRLGRRRVLGAGVALAVLGAAAGGLASSAGELLAARVAQGAGGALATPAALGILAAAFPAGPPRNRALGAWGAAGAAAAAVGVLPCGVLVDAAGWRALFLAQAPLGLALLAALPLLPRDPARAAGGGGLAADLRRVALRPGGPLATAAGFLHGALALGVLVLAALYAQRALGLSATAAGGVLLAARAAAAVAAAAGGRLAARAGTAPLLLAGLAVLTVSFASLARAPDDPDAAALLVPPLIAAGAGSALALVAISIAALEGVREEDAGLASGLLTTSQWTGYAVAAAAASALGLTPGAGADPAAAAADLRLGFAAFALLGLAGLAAAAAVRLRRAGCAGGAAACPA